MYVKIWVLFCRNMLTIHNTSNSQTRPTKYEQCDKRHNAQTHTQTDMHSNRHTFKQTIKIRTFVCLYASPLLFRIFIHVYCLVILHLFSPSWKIPHCSSSPLPDRKTFLKLAARRKPAQRNKEETNKMHLTLSTDWRTAASSAQGGACSMYMSSIS